MDLDLVQEDGSVMIPQDEGSVPSIGDDDDDEAEESTRSVQKNNPRTFTKSPTFIASSGWAADCEALKRQMRSEIDAHQNWNYGMNTLTPTGIANLLGQKLYSRRSFPFYSFCVLAGIEKEGHAHVHIYDAIGSHERVAVAWAGNGKEMLQPILDRMFATVTVTKTTQDSDEMNDNESDSIVKVQRDRRAVHASKQRVGLKLEPPLHCSRGIGHDRKGL